MTFTVSPANLPDWRRVWPLEPPSEADGRVAARAAGIFRSDFEPTVEVLDRSWSHLGSKLQQSDYVLARRWQTPGRPDPVHRREPRDRHPCPDRSVAFIKNGTASGYEVSLKYHRCTAVCVEPLISPLLSTLLLFLGMLLMLEAGRRFGLRPRLQATDSDRGNLSIIESALFAVFGLLMALTFTGAASRFNEKRMLIAEEVTAVQTAYLRLELLPKEQRPALQELFRQYVDSRLAVYRKMPDTQATAAEMAKTDKLQQQIWSNAVTASELPGAHRDAGKLLLPALNNMFDISTVRTMSLQIHPPTIVYGLLFGLALMCALLAGYRMASTRYRSWLHILGFTVITVVVVYVILDLDYLREGLIRLQTADQLLIRARETMS
jgi:hypothetical protein